MPTPQEFYDDDLYLIANKRKSVIPFHFQIDTFRQAEERRGGGAEEKRFVSFIR
jgi:hypothetical protein